LRDALVRLGRREGATLFMVLLAAFEALLHRWTGQSDLTVGSPVAGRTQSEVEGLIGFFVNTLVMRSTLGGRPDFRRHLAGARETALDAWTHQDLPFERLAEELETRRDPSRTPRFQAMLALVDAPVLPGVPADPGSGGVVPPPLGGRAVGSGGGQILSCASSPGLQNSELL